MILNIHYFLLKTTFKVENYHQSAIYIDLVKHESSWLAIQICISLKLLSKLQIPVLDSMKLFFSSKMLFAIKKIPRTPKF